MKNNYFGSSLCPNCTRNVTDKAYYKGKKGSVHLQGTCKRDTFFPVQIPVQSWKSKLPYPMPRKGWEPEINSLEEFNAYWFPKPKDKPKTKARKEPDLQTRIAALLEEQNRLLALLAA